MLRRLQDAEKAVPGFLYGWIAYTAGLLVLAALLRAFRVRGAWHIAGVIGAGASVATICIFGTVYA